MKCIVYVTVLVSLISATVWGQAKPRVVAVNKSALMEGTILDANTQKPIAGAVIIAKSQAGKVQGQQATAADGKFQLTLDPSQSYIVTTRADGYELLEERLAFTSPSADRLTRRPTYLYRTGTRPVTAPATATVATSSARNDLPEARVVARPSSSRVETGPAKTAPRLTPPKTLDAKIVYTPPLTVAPLGKTTQLQAIQFVQSKADLLPDAQPALEQLLAFMQTNPTAEIMLAGHTDNQGDFDENIKLSQQRVDVVKAYLVQNGIAANRITARGYGPTRPIANNNKEATRQQNRRVELIILKL